MNEITNNDVLDFIRLLVNFGEVFKLDESNMTIARADGQICYAPDVKGTAKPIQIVMPNIVYDDAYSRFNPLKQTVADDVRSDKEGVSTLTWFYSSRETTLSVLVKKLILKIVEVGYTKETDGYDNLEFLASISENCDKTMVEELSKINASDFFRIFYMHKSKTAEAQTLVFTDAIEKQHKNFRKKTWLLLSDLFRKLFKLNEDSMKQYSYRATVLSFPEYDARLHVMLQIIDVINPLCKSLLKMDLQPEEWHKHLDRLDTYVRMWAFMTAKASSMNKDISIISNGASWGDKPVAAPTTAPEIDQIPVNLNPQVPTAMPSAAPSPMPAGTAIPVGTPMMPVASPIPAPTMMPNPMVSAMPTAGSYGMPTMMPNPMVSAMPSAAPTMPGMYMPSAGAMMPQAYPTYNAPSTADENRIPVC